MFGNNHTIRFLLILIFFPVVESYACLSASQERIFPIGTVQNDLIGLELIGGRYGKGEFGEKIYWRFSSTLLRYTNTHSEFIINTLESNLEIEGAHVESFLKTQINKAIKLCEKIDNFRLLSPIEISFCDFQSNCSKIALLRNDSILKFKVTNNDSIYDIKYLAQNYNGSMAKPYLANFNNYYDNLDTVGFNLNISSIRTYENEGVEILIFHLGMGQDFKDVRTNKYPLRKEYSFPNALTDLQSSVFMEPLKHHGTGFDYFIIFKK